MAHFEQATFVMQLNLSRALVSLTGILLFVLGGNALAVAPMVSIGSTHGLALRSDGTVLAWGSDINGQLGLGRPLISTVPVPVRGLVNVKAIAAGNDHSLAVRQDGSVWAWGSNDQFGKLGDGTTVDRSSPQQVVGLNDAVDVCAGGWHSAVLKRDGTVWTWGNNWYGQLGHGTTGTTASPAPVKGLKDVSAIACYANQTIALRENGTVWAWGANANGELGNGSVTDQSLPVPVFGLENVASINGTAALKKDGSVWEWGYTTWSTNPPNLVPVRSAGVTDVRALSKSLGGVWGGRLAAIKSDAATWWQWTPGMPPANQSPLPGLHSIATSPAFTLLLKTDGTVLASGLNNSGQMGNGIPPSGDWDWQADFLPVIGLENIVAIVAGDSHALAIDASGNVWAWGDDAHGQLGHGATLSNTLPSVVPGLSNIVQISATQGGTSFALDSGGNVWGWGLNYHGQVGDGTSTNRSTPVRLTSINDVQAVAVGTTWASMALKRDGTVWVWGNVSDGLLGDGTSGAVSNLPTQVPKLENMIAIAGHTSHMLAVGGDGRVWAWGKNDTGQLGLGTTTANLLPVQIPGLSGVKSVATSWGRSYAVSTDGTVKAWGWGGWGALGDGSWRDFNQLSPKLVSGLANVVEISAGTHTLARRADGSVWGWGQTWGGSELGSHPPDTFPAPITAFGPFQRISAGSEISALLSSDGVLYMGGDNSFGQLGDGTFAQHPEFVLAANTEATGVLDLMPNTPKVLPPELVPPFFVKAEKAGELANLSLRATVRGLPATAIQAKSARAANSLAYNLYVAAQARSNAILTWYQLDATHRWSALQWPMAQYLSGVSLGSVLDSVIIQILDDVDVSNLVGSHIYVGYGLDAEEMVTAGRYREIMTVSSPPTR